MSDTSDNKLRRQTKLLYHGHTCYKMKSNHIQIVMRGQGSVELALETKIQEILTFTKNLAFLVQPYMIVSTSIIGLDIQCVQDHDYVNLQIYLV